MSDGNDEALQARPGSERVINSCYDPACRQMSQVWLDADGG
jgi:hypothetical protein